MKFFDLEMDGYLAQKVTVWKGGNNCSGFYLQHINNCMQFIKGPLDETCQSDGTIWREGVGHCQPAQ